MIEMGNLRYLIVPLKVLIHIFLCQLFLSEVQAGSLVTPRLANCGGVLEGTGEINYKLGEQYNANERCVWTIVNNNYDLISIELIARGFAGGDGDHIEIFYMRNGTLQNPVIGSEPHCEGPLLTRLNQWCILNTSLVFLVFRTDQSLHGTGFTVKVNQMEGPVVPVGVYESYTLTQESGFRDYPGSFRSDKVVTWSLIGARQLVIHKFDVTQRVSCDDVVGNLPENTTVPPVLQIYQTNLNNPVLIDTYCGGISSSVTYLNDPFSSVLEPYIVIYFNGENTYDKGEIKFYWNLDDIPTIWKPEPGAAECVAIPRIIIILGLWIVMQI